jgi:hypothetical protein
MERRRFLRAAATAAGVAAGDVSKSAVTDQQNRLLEYADRDDSDRWSYNTDRNAAHVRSGLVNAQLDTLCDNPNGLVETFTVSSDGVPLGFEVTTESEESIGTLVHLSAEQAEALAVDLLEQAHAMRAESTSKQAHSGGSDE